MTNQTSEIRYFFFSQAFADGVRTTFAILLPALVMSYYDLFETGMIISLGALCVSITDSPGPLIHRRNGMLICTGFLFLVSVLTALLRQNPYLIGIELLAVSFLFSMFNVYGSRATAVGNAVILVMILTMDQPVEKSEVLWYGVFVLGGGLWYLLISLLFHNLQPYRAAQRILGECIREVAAYLSIKSDFYHRSTDLDSAYRRLVEKQITVNDKQDAVREMLFKTRQILKESTSASRKLVWTFVETLDLFEEITTTYYDYYSLRKKYADTGILDSISYFIRDLAIELDRMGVAIQLNVPYAMRADFEDKIRALKAETDAVQLQSTESHLVLKKILVRLRRLLQRFNEVGTYFEKEDPKKEHRSPLDHSRFVSHQPLDPRIVWTNLTLESSVFRHAVRVAISCGIGYLVVKTISYGNYSYWILMTIAFILKPAFGLTRQRNIERLIGTLIGGFIGVLVLYFIPNRDVQFVLLVLFMIANYSFMRVNYLAMVLCVTPFVLILFNFLGVDFFDVAQERILDTVIGCAIALSISYFLFPTWESQQLKNYLVSNLKANAGYLQKIIDGLSGKKIGMLDYKLVRKEVYVSSANLTAAFQRMLSEPKNKQRNSRKIHQFTVLSHILFSNVATVATTLLEKEGEVKSRQLCSIAKRALHMLQQSVREMEQGQKEGGASGDPVIPTEQDALQKEDTVLKDQLEFILKVTIDIHKISSKIAATV